MSNPTDPIDRDKLVANQKSGILATIPGWFERRGFPDAAAYLRREGIVESERLQERVRILNMVVMELERCGQTAAAAFLQDNLNKHRNGPV